MTIDSRCDIVTSVQFIITPLSSSLTGLRAVGFSVIREKLHSRNLPAVVDVRLRAFTLHTGATPEGDRVTVPMYA